MAVHGRLAASLPTVAAAAGGRRIGIAAGRRFSTATTPTTPTTTTPSKPTKPAAGSGLAQRSLFVHVKPAPASLSERRSVLRVLERYGKTEMFKKLTVRALSFCFVSRLFPPNLQDNASFICIASTAAMASALIQRSPMQYEFLAETLQAVQPWGQPRVATLVQPVETTGTASAAAEATGTAKSTRTALSPPGVAHRSFILSVFPSHDYHHRTVIRNSPLHGPWPEDDGAGEDGLGGSDGLQQQSSRDYKKTFVYNALKAVVPEGAAADALCDWRRPTRSSSSSSSSSSSAQHIQPPTDRQPAAGAPAALAHIRERKARQARRAQASKSVLGELAARAKAGDSEG